MFVGRVQCDGFNSFGNIKLNFWLTRTITIQNIISIEFWLVVYLGGWHDLLITDKSHKSHTWYELPVGEMKSAVCMYVCSIFHHKISLGMKHQQQFFCIVYHFTPLLIGFSKTMLETHFHGRAYRLIVNAIILRISRKMRFHCEKLYCDDDCVCVCVTGYWAFGCDTWWCTGF